MRKFYIAALAILGLVVAYLNPLQTDTASAANTVTKTITVKKSDGSPYAGALVSVTIYDPATEQSLPISPVTANASGVAALSVPEFENIELVAVQPPAGDVSHGLFVKWSEFTVATNESLEVKLNPSNMIVSPKNSDGSDAGLGNWINYISTTDTVDSWNSYPLLRSGSVGLDINSGLNAGDCYALGITSSNNGAGLSKNYGVKVTGTGANYTPVAYNENCLAVQPSVVASGKTVYELKLAEANLSGALKSTTGQSITLPSGVSARVWLYQGLNGAPNYDMTLTGMLTKTDGTFSLYLEKPKTTIQIFAVVQVSGSATLAFQTQSFWMNTQEQYSNSETGSFSANSSFQLNFTALSTKPNLVLRSVYSGDLSNEPGWFGLVQTNPTNGAWLGPGYSSNGIAAYALEDGTYNLDFSPSNYSHNYASYRVTINGGIASVADSTGINISPNASGDFVLATKEPNLAVKIVLPDNQNKMVSKGSLGIWNSDHSIDIGSNFYRGNYYASVPNGTYTLVVNSGVEGYAETQYSITVGSSGVVISSGATNVNPLNGIYFLEASLPNIKVQALDSSNNPFGQDGLTYLNGQLEKKLPSGSFQTVAWQSARTTGKIGFAWTETGTYRIRLNPWGDPNAVTTFTREFDIDASHQSIDLGTKVLSTPPAKLRVRYAGSTIDLKYSDIEVSSETYYGDASTGTLGVAGLDIQTAGTYTLRVRAPYSNAGPLATTKNYTAVVTGTSGNLSVAISGATQNSSGDFILELGTPNITGKLLTPTGESLATIGSKWINAQFEKNYGEYWGYIDGTSVRQDGSFGFTSNEVGTYRISFRPNRVPGAVNTVTESFDITDANKASFTKSFGELRLASPNAKFKVRTASGSTDLQYSNISISKVQSTFSKFSDGIYTGESGIAEHYFGEVGTYEIRISPEYQKIAGDEPSLAKTYVATVTQGSSAGTFDISIAGLTKDSSGAFILRFGSPNLVGRVVDSLGASLPSTVYTSLNLQKFDLVKQNWTWTNQYAWAPGGSKFGFQVTEAGRYRIRIQPYGSSSNNYALTFSTPFNVTADELQSTSKNLGDVRLAPITLKGTLKSPDGASTIANSQIIAIDSRTGQEMWEYSTATNQSGQWGMTLPEGTYTLIAKAPYGNSTYGNSDPLENVNVDSSGVATITGKNSQALDLRLANPTWSGVVKLPGTSTTVMQNATVCMQLNKSSWNCVQTDSQGRWAFSKPLGFNGFDASSRIIVYPNNELYAQNNIEGALAVTNALGTYASGSTYSNIVLRPLSPNTKVTVTAGGNTVANAWVWVERNGSWLAGGVTDANGMARLNIANPTQDFTVRVDIQGNQSLSGLYANAKKSFLSSDITPVNGVFETVVALPTPNFRGTIKVPAVSGGAAESIAQNSSINIYNVSLNEWVSGKGTGTTGVFSAYLQKPTTGTYTYSVSVDPQYSTDSLQSYRQYQVQVSSNGTTVVTDMVTNQNLTATGGLYDLYLRNASVVGQVTQSDGITSVADSWIEVMQIIQQGSKYLSEKGSNSKQNGSFGLPLNDGNYELRAGSSWSSPGQVPSNKCAIQVTNGVVATPDSDCVTSGKVKLKLREPNLSFTLANNGVALPYTQVYVSAGNWRTWANSDKNGKISLFIDTAQIANESSNLSGTNHLSFSFYPQSNNSDVVRWNCKSGDAKPVCNSVPDFTIGQDFPSTIISTAIQAATPNTKITIKTPAGAVAPNSQVTLYKEMSGYRQWLDYSNADANGQAAFNIENYTSSDTFSIEVRAPWELRQTSATSTYRNISFANLNNHEFTLGTPNLKLNVKQALGAGVSQWGGISIQEVNATTFNYVDWVGGYGVDETGFSAIKLENSKTYKLTAYPGYKAAGTATDCFVSVNGSGVVSTVSGKCTAITNIVNGVADFTLSAGNVVGRVVRPNGTSPVEGAIVFAEAYDSASGNAISGMTREAVTNANGDWGLQLETSYTWKLKVFYVNLPTDVPQLSSVTTPIVVTRTQLTSATGSIDVPVTLSAKP